MATWRKARLECVVTVNQKKITYELEGIARGDEVYSEIAFSSLQFAAFAEIFNLYSRTQRIVKRNKRWGIEGEGPASPPGWRALMYRNLDVVPVVSLHYVADRRGVVGNISCRFKEFLGRRLKRKVG